MAAAIVRRIPRSAYVSASSARRRSSRFVPFVGWRPWAADRLAALYEQEPESRATGKPELDCRGNRMNAFRDIHWKRILVAGFMAEAAIFAIFFLLLLVATLAGVPDIARPGSTLDYIDAIAASFAMVFLATLWVGKRIESRFVLHGVLIGVLGVVLFGIVILAGTGTLAQHPLYFVAHGLKVIGGVAGGLVARRRKPAFLAPGRAH